MSEWKETEFGKIPIDWNFIIGSEYCIKVTDGTHDSPKQKAEGYPLITSKHIKGREIDFANAYLISEDDFNKINERSYVEQWDVIISMIGEYCGFTYIERNSKIEYAVKNVGLFKTGSKINALWLHYYLNSPIGKHIIDFNKSGSSQPYISLGALRDIPILTPPLPEQKAIAEVLSSLDDKIDLLHRQNKTLEAMAETIFRQWFIEDADEGWEEMALSFCVDITIGRTPPRKESEWFSTNPKDIKWISIKDMGNEGAYVYETSEYLTNEAVDRFRIPVIPKNTVVLSFKMTVGRVKITTENMLSNEAIAHFRFKETTPFTKEYLYLYLKLYPYQSLGSTSSIVTSINSRMIRNMNIHIPNKDLMKEFKIQTTELFSKIKCNQKQIIKLENIRDLLLPKLMCGEVRVMN
jgi:type I restriction enzyme, S subunit